MNIVGINGFKRSGKGETARLLAAQHPGVVYEVGFADKLKILAAKTLGIVGGPRDLIAYMDDFKEEGWVEFGQDSASHGEVTGRRYLQNLGNEARNVLGDTLWIDVVLPRPYYEDGHRLPSQDDARLRSRYPDVDVVAITDLRYPNEAERIKALGGVVWEVVRPGLESDGHASEQPLDRRLVDEVIVNDGSLDDLSAKVAVAMVNTLC